jgi:3-hydroxyisobutyrate dehydrogenase
MHTLTRQVHGRRSNAPAARPRFADDQPLPTISVLGAGVMGGAMAGRLLESGMDVAVWARHPASTAPLIERGATAFADAVDAVAKADVVITMLPTAEATRAEVIEGPVLRAIPPGAVWAQMGTIGVVESERLAAEVHRLRPDVTFVDAPVSGSRVPAEAGQLLILASGPADAAGKLHPVFAALGRKTLWLGAAGAGSRMKLVLNTWLAFETEAAAEAAALTERFGLRPADLVSAMQGNALGSDYALAKLARINDEDYHLDFSLEWALKDLDLVVAQGGEDAAPVAEAIAARWRDLVDEGWGRFDVSAARIGLESGTQPLAGAGTGAP